MKLFDLCKQLLEEKPERRNSDKKLMWAVWYRLGYANNVSFLFMDFIKSGCPTPESITRCRRKIQQLYPELKASRAVQKERKIKEKTKGTWIFRDNIAILDE